ncbi:MAG: hypothetical protein EBY20_00535 [Alphaproteobacteria bacterium]|uniref:Uncharacterized protein n=1 Tax=viral metagenome TaxID=1070528 RepID=A0A6C0HQY4_9ZZZZ|nr:hypothetical protein [Alphaproteobacteria bacterium]
MTTIAYHQYTNIPYMSGSYASAPVIGPLSTNRTPSTTVQNQLGVLTGVHPNPPQFYPSDGASTFSQARAQYRRTNTTQFNFGRGTQSFSFLRPTTQYSADLQKSFTVSQSTKYTPPASSSMYMAAKKSAAVGKSSLKQGLPVQAPLAYKSYDRNDVKTALRMVRSGGCVAPAKKGSIYNRSLCSGAACPWGALVTQNY